MQNEGRAGQSNQQPRATSASQAGPSRERLEEAKANGLFNPFPQVMSQSDEEGQAGNIRHSPRSHAPARMSEKKKPLSFSSSSPEAPPAKRRRMHAGPVDVPAYPAAIVARHRYAESDNRSVQNFSEENVRLGLQPDAEWINNIQCSRRARRNNRLYPEAREEPITDMQQAVSDSNSDELPPLVQEHQSSNQLRGLQRVQRRNSFDEEVFDDLYPSSSRAEPDKAEAIRSTVRHVDSMPRSQMRRGSQDQPQRLPDTVRRSSAAPQKARDDSHQCASRSFMVRPGCPEKRFARLSLVYKNRLNKSNVQTAKLINPLTASTDASRKMLSDAAYANIGDLMRSSIFPEFDRQPRHGCRSIVASIQFTRENHMISFETYSSIIRRAQCLIAQLVAGQVASLFMSSPSHQQFCDQDGFQELHFVFVSRPETTLVHAQIRRILVNFIDACVSRRLPVRLEDVEIVTCPLDLTSAGFSHNDMILGSAAHCICPLPPRDSAWLHDPEYVVFLACSEERRQGLFSEMQPIIIARETYRRDSPGFYYDQAKKITKQFRDTMASNRLSVTRQAVNQVSAPYLTVEFVRNTIRQVHEEADTPAMAQLRQASSSNIDAENQYNLPKMVRSRLTDTILAQFLNTDLNVLVNTHEQHNVRTTIESLVSDILCNLRLRFKPEGSRNLIEVPLDEFINNEEYSGVAPQQRRQEIKDRPGKHKINYHLNQTVGDADPTEAIFTDILSPMNLDMVTKVAIWMNRASNDPNSYTDQFSVLLQGKPGGGKTLMLACMRSIYHAVPTIEPTRAFVNIDQLAKASMMCSDEQQIGHYAQYASYYKERMDPNTRFTVDAKHEHPFTTHSRPMVATTNDSPDDEQFLRSLSNVPQAQALMRRINVIPVRCRLSAQVQLDFEEVFNQAWLEHKASNTMAAYAFLMNTRPSSMVFNGELTEVPAAEKASHNALLTMFCSGGAYGTRLAIQYVQQHFMRHKARLAPNRQVPKWQIMPWNRLALTVIPHIDSQHQFITSQYQHLNGFAAGPRTGRRFNDPQFLQVANTITNSIKVERRARLLDVLFPVTLTSGDRVLLTKNLKPVIQLQPNNWTDVGALPTQEIFYRAISDMNWSVISQTTGLNGHLYWTSTDEQYQAANSARNPGNLDVLRDSMNNEVQEAIDAPHEINSMCCCFPTEGPENTVISLIRLEELVIMHNRLLTPESTEMTSVIDQAWRELCWAYASRTYRRLGSPGKNDRLFILPQYYACPFAGRVRKFNRIFQWYNLAISSTNAFIDGCFQHAPVYIPQEFRDMYDQLYLTENVSKTWWSKFCLNMIRLLSEQYMHILRTRHNMRVQIPINTLARLAHKIQSVWFGRTELAYLMTIPQVPSSENLQPSIENVDLSVSLYPLPCNCRERLRQQKEGIFWAHRLVCDLRRVYDLVQRELEGFQFCAFCDTLRYLVYGPANWAHILVYPPSAHDYFSFNVYDRESSNLIQNYGNREFVIQPARPRGQPNIVDQDAMFQGNFIQVVVQPALVYGYTVGGVIYFDSKESPVEEWFSDIASQD